MTSHIPVTILTGFLGAGKTTLLNRILSSDKADKVAVIVNEFGDIGIDDQLITHKEGNRIELSTGAVCCAAMGDTVKVLSQLLDLKSEGKVKRVIIETTGLADPFPLVKAFLNRPMLAKAYVLDAIVTVVDAFHLPNQLMETPEAAKQIAAADIILLNKTDLVATDELGRLQIVITQINPHATIYRTTRSDADLDLLIGSPVVADASRPYTKSAVFASEEHGHNPNVGSIVLREARPLNLDRLAHWIGSSLMLNAEQLMRYKGILNIQGREERFVFQGVHHQFETLPDRAWREEEERKSEIVLIGRGLDRKEFEEGFVACAADLDETPKNA